MTTAEAVSNKKNKLYCVYHVQISRSKETSEQWDVKDKMLNLKELFKECFDEVFSGFVGPEIPIAEVVPEFIFPRMYNISLYIQWFSKPHPYIMRVLDHLLEHIYGYEIQWIREYPEMPDPKKDYENIQIGIMETIGKFKSDPELKKIQWTRTMAPRYFESVVQKEKGNKAQITDPCVEHKNLSLLLRIKVQFKIELDEIFQTLYDRFQGSEKIEMSVGDLKKSDKFLYIINLFYRENIQVFYLLWEFVFGQEHKRDILITTITEGKLEVKGTGCGLIFTNDAGKSRVVFSFELFGGYNEAGWFLDWAIFNHIMNESNNLINPNEAVIFNLESFELIN